MEVLISSIISDPSADALELEACPACAVTEAMWADLAAQIAREPTLIPYPVATLAARCADGNAAAAIWQGQIISYIALVPVACRFSRPGALHTWAELCAAAGHSPAHMPSLDVFEFTSSWTAPAWRRKGVSMALRPPLLARCLDSQSVALSGMAGLASPVLARLGWQVLGWSAAPFASSLIGFPSAALEDCVAVGWRPPAGMTRYEGSPIDPRDPAAAWSHCCYFWVSDCRSVQQLDAELAEIWHGDVCRWRAAVIDRFSQSGAVHRLALLP